MGYYAVCLKFMLKSLILFLVCVYVCVCVRAAGSNATMIKYVKKQGERWRDRVVHMYHICGRKRQN